MNRSRLKQIIAEEMQVVMDAQVNENFFSDFKRGRERVRQARSRSRGDMARQHALRALQAAEELRDQGDESSSEISEPPPSSSAPGWAGWSASPQSSETKKASPEEKEKASKVKKLATFVAENNEFYENIKYILKESEDLETLVDFAGELDLPKINLEESLVSGLSKLIRKWIKSKNFAGAADSLLTRLVASKKNIAHEIAKVKKYISNEKDPSHQQEGVKIALKRFIKLYNGAGKILEAYSTHRESQT